MISKQKLYLYIIFVIVGLLTSNAFADFYVIAGGGKKVGTEIKALPYPITQPGFYFITKNLNGGTADHGITIDTNDVTLDLMGFALVGPGGTGDYSGIYSVNKKNIEVRNGTIRDFKFNGYYGFSSTSHCHRIINIRAVNNGNDGIKISGYSHLVKDCTSFSNGAKGINTSHGSTVTGNTCYDNGNDGIYTGNGCTITGNTCYNNDDDGLECSEGCTVTENTCDSNVNRGIMTSSGSKISGNTCRGNLDGISAGTGSSVIGNTCYSNTELGIALMGNNYAGQNTCYDNGTNMNDCGTACTMGDNHAP